MNVYFDTEIQEPVNMKFLRFENEEITDDQVKCYNGRHNNEKWVTTKTRFYINRIPKTFRPFSMYIWVCRKCGLPHKVEFLIYSVDPETLPKVGDILQDHGTKQPKLTSTKSTGIRRIDLEEKE